MIERDHITGLVLAGGRGRRMGCVDKGLQRHDGVPLAMRALLRLSPQVGRVVISANRNLQTYAAMGVAVWPDALPGFAGPLAGFLSGLERCSTPFMLAVPCDAPMFPADLAQRLAQALEAEHAEIAKAVTRDGEALRAQPVFCLMKTILRASLARFVESGQRKVDAWTALHHTVEVPFPEARAFTNVNTPDELAQLQLKSCGGYESRSTTRR